MKRKTRPKSVPWFIPVLIFVAVGVLFFAGGRILDGMSRGEEPTGDPDDRYAREQTFEFDGVRYRRKKGLTTILLMGVDREDDSTEGRGYRNHGQADFLRLVVIDSKNEIIHQMQIDRDTMTPITVLGIMGNKSGMRTTQISLSHSFGDGAQKSCELTCDAVSNLLFGAEIDFYMALNMDGISVLNDAVGGVTVTLADDFSHIDPTMIQGATMTLVGDQAEIFVRTRRSMNVGTNEARMVRQQQYIAALSALLDQKVREDQSFIGTLYDSLEAYMVTNIRRARLINEVWAARNYRRSELIAPQGVHQIGNDGFSQFIVDEKALEKIVVELFYEPVK